MTPSRRRIDEYKNWPDFVPTWKVWAHEEGEESSRIYRALCAVEAVEKWAEEEDYKSAEYSIVGGREQPVVCVRGKDGEVEQYQVRGRTVPEYFAWPVE